MSKAIFRLREIGLAVLVASGAVAMLAFFNMYFAHEVYLGFGHFVDAKYFHAAHWSAVLFVCVLYAAAFVAAFYRQHPASVYTGHFRDIPCLRVGRATGEFNKRGFGRAAHRGTDLSLDLANAFRGTMILGPQGSGKTSSFFYPLLQQWLAYGYGGLIFCVKSDVAITVQRLCSSVGREAMVVGPRRARMNLLTGLAPDAAAGAIKESLGRSREPFWVSAPTSFARAWLDLLYALPPTTIELPEQRDKDGSTISPARSVALRYSLDALAQVMYFSPSDLKSVLAIAGAEYEAAPPERRTPLQRAMQYFTHEYAATFMSSSAGANMLAGVRATLLPHVQALTRSAELREAFCSGTDVSLGDLNRGAVIAIDVPDDEFKDAGPFVNRLVFARFAQLCQERLRANGNVMPVLLWADEYASFASPDHLAPFSRARQARFAPLVGVQSLAGLSAALQDDRAARGLVGAFASMVVCGASDPETREYATKMLGQVKTWENTQSRTAGGGRVTTTRSRQSRMQDLAGAHLFAELGPTGRGDVRAIAMLAHDGGLLADLVIAKQYYS